MSHEDIKNRIVDYLRSHNILTLATVTPDGKPLAHTVTYVSDGLTVYFGTYKTTRKAQNITHNPHVAYSVDEDYADWSKIQGIQMSGNASPITDQNEMGRIWNKFLEKFPAAKDLPQSPDMVIFKIIPSCGYFIDYSKGFTHRDEIKL
jgi:general stress protein 26